MEATTEPDELIDTEREPTTLPLAVSLARTLGDTDATAVFVAPCVELAHTEMEAQLVPLPSELCEALPVVLTQPDNEPVWELLKLCSGERDTERREDAEPAAAVIEAP